MRRFGEVSGDYSAAYFFFFGGQDYPMIEWELGLAEGYWRKKEAKDVQAVKHISSRDIENLCCERIAMLYKELEHEPIL